MDHDGLRRGCQPDQARDPRTSRTRCQPDKIAPSGTTRASGTSAPPFRLAPPSRPGRPRLPSLRRSRRVRDGRGPIVPPDHDGPRRGCQPVKTGTRPNRDPRTSPDALPTRRKLSHPATSAHPGRLRLPSIRLHPRIRDVCASLPPAPPPRPRRPRSDRSHGPRRSPAWQPTRRNAVAPKKGPADVPGRAANPTKIAPSGYPRASETSALPFHRRSRRVRDGRGPIPTRNPSCTFR